MDIVFFLSFLFVGFLIDLCVFSFYKPVFLGVDLYGISNCLIGFLDLLVFLDFDREAYIFIDLLVDLASLSL